MPARDDDQAMEGLLRRSLARDAAKAGECPHADILAAYYERSLDADEAAGEQDGIVEIAVVVHSGDPGRIRGTRGGQRAHEHPHGGEEQQRCASQMAGHGTNIIPPPTRRSVM